MHPTEILSAEHRVIEQVLDALVVLVQRSREDGRLDAAQARAALAFLSDFADGVHHAKEEERLFPMLVARGMPRHVGPIGVMLDDHRAGREHVARMAAACDAGDLEGFARAALNYAALMREHIGKEDAVLFPMAESMLDADARETLLAAFRASDPRRERLIASAAELARRFGVPLAAERGPSAAPDRCGPGCP